MLFYMHPLWATFESFPPSKHPRHPCNLMQSEETRKPQEQKLHLIVPRLALFLMSSQEEESLCYVLMAFMILVKAFVNLQRHGEWFYEERGYS